MKFKGTAHCFGNNVTSDSLTPTKLKETKLTMKEYVKYMLDDLRPGFYKEIKPGDFIVAGTNFGCGSSRESAAAVIRAAEMAGVIANSFSRIFLRNSVSVGLPLFECDTSLIKDGDEIEVDTDTGIIKTPSCEIEAKPFPPALLEVVLAGGMLKYFLEHNDYKV